MPKVKIPKRVGGVKIPKKVRKRANRAIGKVDNAAVRELASAAIGAAAGARRVRARVRFADDGPDLDGGVSRSAMDDRDDGFQSRHNRLRRERVGNRERASPGGNLAVDREQRLPGFGKRREVRLPPVGIELAAIALDPRCTVVRTSIIGPERAFLASGRFMVTTRVCPSCSTRQCGCESLMNAL